MPLVNISNGALVKFNNETTVWNTKMAGWLQKGDLAIVIEANTKGQSWYRIMSSKYIGWVTGDHMEEIK